MRLSSEILIDHHTIDQKDIVVGRSAVDGDLIVDAIRIDAWREQRGLADISSDRQFRNCLLLEIGADLRRLEHRRCRCSHGNGFRHRGQLQVGIDVSGCR